VLTKRLPRGVKLLAHTCGNMSHISHYMVLFGLQQSLPENACGKVKVWKSESVAFLVLELNL
jgi:hypothetical protein